MTSWLWPAESAVSLPRTVQNRRRESQTSRSGDIFQLNDRLSCSFFLIVTRFVVSMYLLWKKKCCQNVLKVAKYSAKVALVTRELMAEGGGYCCGPPQINGRMGNTGGCLWKCQQFSSTQNELYGERGDCPIVNPSGVVSLSRAD